MKGGYHAFRRDDKVFELAVSYDDETAELVNVRRATLAEQGLKAVPTPEEHETRARCSTCGAAEIWTWLGIRWQGRPWPLRWHFAPASGGVLFIEEAGCGCIIRLKRIVAALRVVWLVATERVAA